MAERQTRRLPDRNVPVIPWQERRRIGRWRAYWRTVFLVLRRNGYMGDFLDGPVDYRSARSFRWITIALVLLVPGGYALFKALAVLAGRWLAGRLTVSVVIDTFAEAPQRELAVVQGALLTALATMTGVVSWFFCPRRLDTEAQNRGIALSHYSCAPLALLPIVLAVGFFPLRALCRAVPSLAEAPTLTVFPLAVCGGIVLFHWWLLVAYFGRTVARRGPVGALLAAIGVAACWVLVNAAIWAVLAYAGALLVLIPPSLT